MMNTKCFGQMTVLALAACTSVSYAQVINEDLKLLPADAAGGYGFGSPLAIAIYDDVIAIGVSDSAEGSITSGSAYLFDSVTGAEIVKLLPNDGAFDDQFGASIAISNGVVAIGAPGDDDNGNSSGSVYLFDAVTGTQFVKLQPSDGSSFDYFGESIAMGNGVVAIGARGDDDNGSFSGSVYLFDSTTGTQLSKLRPNDGVAGDAFGGSLAIHGGLVAIGASGDDDSGINSGSAYLFDTATGVQLAKFLPNDGTANLSFGSSIAINNGMVAVGAVGDVTNGLSSGSAYIFDAITGTQLSKLVPSDGSFGDIFGRSIALGNGVVAVGADGNDDNGQNSGSAYLFDAATGVELAKILPNDGAEEGGFGSSIAIGTGVVAVAANGDDATFNNTSSAYLFDLSTGFQLGQFLPRDWAAWDFFGDSIAFDSGMVAIGASQDDDNGRNSGSAFLFDATTGGQLFKLLPGDGASGDEFGSSIAIDNGVVVVGSPKDSGNADRSGSAYLFDSATGGQLSKLLAGDGGAGDQFGHSIAIDNGIVAVGAWGDDDNGSDSGSVYLFDVATGEQLAKLLPSDGAAFDNFGDSVAINDGVVAVGARLAADSNGNRTGSAYLFDAATGAQLFKLLTSDGVSGDFFGISIDISNGIVAVGTLQGAVSNGESFGSAYLFDVATGAQFAKLLPNDSEESDFFGYSIAIDNGVVAVGASQGNDNNGISSGSAYLFDAATGDQLFKLLPNDGAAGDSFGDSIAIDNGVVVVAATGDDVNGQYAGSAYIFNALSPQCPADLTGDGVLNFFDVSAFLVAFAAQDPIADFNSDGVYNFFDVSAFLSAFSAGCD